MSPEHLAQMESALQQVTGFIYPNEVELHWSILVVIYPYITGLVAGAFILASLEKVFKVKDLQPTYRLALLTALGRPELYLLWAAAWLTTHTLVTRIRSIAEHALTPDPDDPLGNTRTAIARWWERLLIAPHRVNYHLEHHLLMTVPHYNLPRMHRLLRERGVLDGACVERGYWPILVRAASRPELDDTARDDEESADLSQINGF